MMTFSQHGSHSNRSASAVVLASAIIFAGFAIAATGARANEPIRNDDIIVRFDQSQLVKLPRTIAEVIVGNPSIADVSVHSSNTLVLTGKGFGLTNLIVLDADRNVISEQRILVQRDEYKTVNVTRGVARQTLNCAPNCNPTVTIGDEPAYFATTKAAMEAKAAQAERSGTEATAGAQQ